jgi:hypothetical protein
MLTAPHVVALGALSTSANAMAGLGKWFCVRFPWKPVPKPSSKAERARRPLLNGSFMGASGWAL